MAATLRLAFWESVDRCIIGSGRTAPPEGAPWPSVQLPCIRAASQFLGTLPKPTVCALFVKTSSISPGWGLGMCILENVFPDISADHT